MRQPNTSPAWAEEKDTPAQPHSQEANRFSPLASLRIRLMLFVLLAVLPILGIMLYAAFESRQQEAANVEKEVLTLTQLAVDNHEQLIEGSRQLLISLAESSEIQQGQAEACRQKLSSLLEQSQGYASFAVADLEGVIFCNAVPLNERVNVARQSWFQQAVESGDFVIDTYRLGRLTGKANLPLSYPVRDEAGQIQGVIVAGLDLRALNRAMTQTSLPEGAALIVIDRNGTILARYPNSENWIGQTILSAPLIEAILTQSWGVVEVPDFDDISRLYAFSPLRNKDEKEIYLGVGVPRQAAFAQINLSWARNLAGLGLIGLLALAVAWWGSDALVLGPIKALMGATQELRHNLGARTGLAYDAGELGRLARTFDEMAATLEQREAERRRPHQMLEDQAARLREQAHLLELAHDAHFLEAVGSVLGAAMDRKRIEDELQLSRHQLATILQGTAEGISAQDANGYLVYANQTAARLLGFFSAEAVPQLPLQELLQKFEILDEAGQPLPWAQFPGQLALKGEANPSATVRFRAISSGEERWLEVKARPIANQRGQIKLVVNIFYDITALKRSEQAHRILAGAGKLLSSSLEESDTLARVSQLVVPHLADWCMIHLVEEEGSIRQVGLAHADPGRVKWAENLQRRYPPDWEAPTGVPNVLRTGQSEFYAEIPDEMIEAAARDRDHLDLLQELNMKSAMIVPLTARERTLGAMIFVWAESGRRYEKRDLALAEELGRRAALAVENSRLYRETQALNSELEQRVIIRTAQLRAANVKLEQEMAEHQQTQAELVEMQRRLMAGIEAERLHLAQELHDGPVQDLYSISYSLSGLQEITPEELGQTQLTAAQKTLQQVIQTLRATSGELRPPTLAPFGLEKALRSHLEQFQESHPDLELELELMPDGQMLSEQARLALYRICQEALNNIGRHADAQRVSVKLSLDADQVSLVVRDDGRGFEVPRRWIGLARQGHLGLVGMSERAEALGGKLEVDSTLGAGTVVRVTVPRDSAAAGVPEQPN